MKEKALNLLGLMRRANAISVGELNTGAVVKAGKAKLLLLALDASDNAAKRAEGFKEGRRVLELRLPFTKAELSAALGLNGCSMAAVTDMGFSQALLKILAEIDSEQYAPFLEEIKARSEKAERRKKGADALKRKKQIGKRRTKA